VQKICPPLDDHPRAHFDACTGALLAPQSLIYIYIYIHTIARDPSSSSVLPAVTAALDVNGPWRGGGVRTSRSTA
jgi:hypothetical protein